MTFLREAAALWFSRKGLGVLLAMAFLASVVHTIIDVSWWEAAGVPIGVSMLCNAWIDWFDDE